MQNSQVVRKKYTVWCHRSEDGELDVYDVYGCRREYDVNTDDRRYDGKKRGSGDGLPIRWLTARSLNPIDSLTALHYI